MTSYVTSVLIGCNPIKRWKNGVIVLYLSYIIQITPYDISYQIYSFTTKSKYLKLILWLVRFEYASVSMCIVSGIFLLLHICLFCECTINHQSCNSVGQFKSNINFIGLLYYIRLLFFYVKLKINLRTVVWKTVKQTKSSSKSNVCWRQCICWILSCHC